MKPLRILSLVLITVLFLLACHAILTVKDIVIFESVPLTTRPELMAVFRNTPLGTNENATILVETDKAHLRLISPADFDTIINDVRKRSILPVKIRRVTVEKDGDVEIITHPLLGLKDQYESYYKAAGTWTRYEITVSGPPVY
jgi:hypothetical protein